MANFAKGLQSGPMKQERQEMAVDVQTVWDGCQKALREAFTPREYDSWVRPVRPQPLDPNTPHEVHLLLPSAAFAEYLDEHLELLNRHFLAKLGKEYHLFYDTVWNATEHLPRQVNTVQPMPSQYTQRQTVSIPQQPTGIVPRDPFAFQTLSQIQVDPQLRPEFSFANFVVGPCNRSAHTAAKQLVDCIGRSNTFNPFVIYGKMGLGKTHLANAIGIAVREYHPENVVLYVTTDQFMSQYVQATQDNTVNQFLAFYRSINLLIVDDVHNFSGRKGTQDIFFSLYNYLHQHGRQLVFTSDRPPVALSGIRSDLLSRFKWGVSMEIAAPDYATRLAILEQHCAHDGIDSLPHDVLCYIAENVSSDIRELEGVLNSIVTYSMIEHDAITVEFARHVLRDLITPRAQRELSLDDLLAQVAKHYQIATPDILGPSRKRAIVQARQMVIYLARQYTSLSAEALGAAMGNRNHSTILYSCRQVENLRETDALFRQELEDLARSIELMQ